MDAQLRVAQVIFARVEAAYSPERRSAYQIVCRSTSLSPGEVAEIKQRVECFQQQVDIVRLQFFRLGSGKVVCSHTKLLTEPNPIIDSTGRTGAFIAHCLVLTQAQFAEFANDPFAIFENYSFQEDPERMIEHIDATAADEHHCRLSVMRTTPTSSYWQLAEALKLVALALEAETLTGRGQSLLMVGLQERILTTLQTAIALTPYHRRLMCSFDTCVDSCSPPSGQYWAVGASARQSRSGYVEISLEGRATAGSTAIYDQRDLYLAWLRSLPAHQVVDEQLIARAFTIQILARAFLDGSTLPKERLSEEACSEFFTLYQPQVTQGLKAALKDVADKPIGERLIHFLYSRVVEAVDMVDVLAMAAPKRVEPKFLGEWVVGWVGAEQPVLKDQEWRDLLTLLERNRSLAVLDRLESYVLNLDDQALHAVEKWIKKHPDLPEQFRLAIAQRRDALGGRAGLFRFLKRG